MPTGSAADRLRRRSTVAGAAVGWPLFVAVVWPAPVVAAASPPAASTVENEPVRYHQGAAAAVDGRAAAPATDTGGDVSHILAALAIVVAVILSLRWGLRKFALVPASGSPGRGVRLLSRTVLAPKQQVLLLQVGRRVIVVGDGGGTGMRPLCEITDPDEVAALVGDSKSAATATSPARSFGSLFKRASDPFTTDEDPAPALAQPRADVPGDVVGLLDKVRGLRQQFDR